MTQTLELDFLVDRTRGPQPWRRLFHAVNGLIVVGLLVFLDPSWALSVTLLTAIVALLFLTDGARFAIPSLNRLFFRLFRPFASPREAQGVASSTWYMLGILLAVAFFPREIAIPAILVLALADPLASYLGYRFGKRRFGSGSVLGTGVFFMASLAILIPLAGMVPALITAAVVALLEPIPWSLDDNLVIPLAVGALLWTLLPFAG